VSYGVGLRLRHLPWLDEPHLRLALAIEKEPKKCFAIAISAADDLLLALVPFVLPQKFVERGLGCDDQLARRLGPFARGDLVPMPTADHVRNAILMAVDGKLVDQRQRPAGRASSGQLLLGAEPLPPRLLAASQRLPQLAVDAKRVQRIDVVVPQIERLAQQAVFRLDRAGEEVLLFGEGGVEGGLVRHERLLEEK
jgi:hypothetical protein